MIAPELGLSPSPSGPPALSHGAPEALPEDSGGPVSGPVCAVCGVGSEDPVFCPAHLAAWMTSKERVRWAYWLAFLGSGPQAVALMDFVRTTQAEERNAPMVTP